MQSNYITLFVYCCVRVHLTSQVNIFDYRSVSDVTRLNITQKQRAIFLTIVRSHRFDLPTKAWNSCISITFLNRVTRVTNFSLQVVGTNEDKSQRYMYEN